MEVRTILVLVTVTFIGFKIVEAFPKLALRQESDKEVGLERKNHHKNSSHPHRHHHSHPHPHSRHHKNKHHKHESEEHKQSRHGQKSQKSHRRGKRDVSDNEIGTQTEIPPVFIDLENALMPVKNFTYFYEITDTSRLSPLSMKIPEVEKPDINLFEFLRNELEEDLTLLDLLENVYQASKVEEDPNVSCMMQQTVGNIWRQRVLMKNSNALANEDCMEILI